MRQIQKTPVSSASVFLSNTSVGVITADDGSFTINPFPEGRYDLVVSCLGYEVYTISLSSLSLPDFLEITLKPRVQELQEVIVASYEKNGWAKWGKLFMERMLGNTPNAFDCKLLNKEVVKFRYNKKTAILHAYSEEPLRIKNAALGYDLQYDLVDFEYNFATKIFFYEGYPLFREMPYKRISQYLRWEKNRATSYDGSILHFMRSLYRNTLTAEGFQLRRVIRNTNQSNAEKPTGQQKGLVAAILVNQPLTGDSIAFAIDSLTAGLQFSGNIQVVFSKKSMPVEYTAQQRGVAYGQSITSEIYMPNPSKVISVISNGSFYSGRDLLSQGYWAWSEKLPDMLPLEYKRPANTP